MAESKKKCRQYSVEYLKFSFLPSKADKRLPTCLLCNKVLSNDSMKPSKLEDHLRRCHPDKIGKDLKYFQTLKEKYEKRPTVHSMFSSTSESNDDGLRASYNISLLIAKSGKPHTIGEQLILPAVEEVLKTVLHKSSFDILKRIPLSNNTVQRRIDEMSSDVESFLCDYLRTTHFSIQLDESTLPGNEALLLSYVRFVMGEEIHKDLLFAKTLKTETKGEPIFNILSDFFKREIDFIHKRYFGDNRWSSCHGRAISFEDILSMEIPPWIINLFDETEDENVILQEELFELSTNEELKVTFKRGYQKFWLQPQRKFPQGIDFPLFFRDLEIGSDVAAGGLQDPAKF
ncbi:Zinc finger BED domain-containing protein 5 [Eumeta japonica]|uniref:Zinc finger BED domain-containing protein 5 n=1 Tax=Eumeta variegata TaxID=151549 RepID=A0A4C1TU65_EUMVA|nr:Zinc finger BED domain-containing protein 5 [Eumeta japonica]